MQYREKFFIGSIVISIVAAIGVFFEFLPFWLFISIFLLSILGWVDYFQTKHSIRRNFPLIGRLRYVFESIRPELQQYFVESDVNGKPINRVERSIIYQRAKDTVDTTPFGTKLDVYEEGYEWMSHSIYALHHKDLDFHPRVKFGGKDCTQPYEASILNISAMSFGSLSQNAVLAMNRGAKLGGFAQNTGEGGISPYHLENGGDLIWQIGTGYFGARDFDGNFDIEVYKKNALLPNVKMIELKLSQGAKPGHGGILPAKKCTEEIAKIRNVKPFTEVNSPPGHSAFQDAKGLLEFIQTLRTHSGGKPTGFKLCIGNKSEFDTICQEMVSTGIKPDFITVDGGEGGTGAAPLEFSDHMGMPLNEGLTYVVQCLEKYDLKKDIRVIASGRVNTAFQLAKLCALGADTCNAARAMMVAVGCIQALECNTNTCPTGVATQDPSLMKGLDVGDKSIRIKNFHEKTVHTLVEMLAAAGVRHPSELKKSQFYRRLNPTEVRTFEEIYAS